uniref:GMP reductase n=1 Tax=Alexandrium catenella TaxID=2925 RepID=A0A7S1RIV4_ALECA|mmetsp:Transcript_59516/g.159433  ORF Transcript_59516/g.159433 Transcript_59516/m.159433 type:complete len:382 (+) Transcript_59516:91-1236(+)
MPHVENEMRLDFKDVLIRPKRSSLASRSQVTVERTFHFRNSKRQWTGAPLIAANMDTIGTFEVAAVLAQRKCITAVHKHYTVEEWKAWGSGPGKDILDCVAVSTGILAKDMEKTGQILEAVPGVSMVCIDVANGYSEAFVQCIRDTRKQWPNITIMAGNVVTKEMTEELIFSGADIIKVGIGPGSVCTTRKQTGVGYPQLSAVLECADAAHGLGGRIVSDGGCTCPGDVCKAFGAGADFVMLGGMLAGHHECAGDVVEEEGSYFKVFYGMSSDTAMKKHVGGVAEYRSSEGKTVRVPYRGPMDETIRDILGGVRSACTYVGASELRELPKRTTFIRVTQQLNPTFTESQKVNNTCAPPGAKRPRTEESSLPAETLPPVRSP